MVKSSLGNWREKNKYDTIEDQSKKIEQHASKVESSNLVQNQNIGHVAI